MEFKIRTPKNKALTGEDQPKAGTETSKNNAAHAFGSLCHCHSCCRSGARISNLLLFGRNVEEPGRVIKEIGRGNFGLARNSKKRAKSTPSVKRAGLPMRKHLGVGNFQIAEERPS